VTNYWQSERTRLEWDQLTRDAAFEPVKVGQKKQSKLDFALIKNLPEN